jgi:hypothetical protein
MDTNISEERAMFHVHILKLDIAHSSYMASHIRRHNIKPNGPSRTDFCFVQVPLDVKHLSVRLPHALNFNSVVLVRKRTIPTERPQPVGEISTNFS